MSQRFATSASLAIAAAVHAQTVLYVDDDAPPGGDGLSWQTAFDDLHAALDIANTGAPVEIRVGDGLYFPDLGTGDSGLKYVINSAAIVSIRGAFAGLGAKDPDEQDFVKYATRLSGDLLQNDDDTPESNFDNSDLIMRIVGPTPANVVLEGLEMTDSSFYSFSGALTSKNAVLDVSNCTFANNVSQSDGGAIRLRSGGATFQSCRFLNNSSPKPRGGGAIYSQSSAVTINGCTFVDNHTGRSGGALHISGAESVVKRSIFVGQTSIRPGGAIFTNDAGNLPTSITIASCVFYQNTIVGTSYDGTAIAARGPTHIVNCTFALNSDDRGDAAPIDDDGGSPSGANCIFWSTGPAPQGAFSYSIVEGGLDGIGNLDVDPQFVDLDAGDLRLSPYSPAIDAGTNESAVTGRDVAGLPRRADDPAVRDTGFGEAPIVDIGAHEFQGSSCTADFNADGATNVLDFVAFQEAFAAGDQSADCTMDGALTILDFVCFQQAFVEGCP